MRISDQTTYPCGDLLLTRNKAENLPCMRYTTSDSFKGDPLQSLPTVLLRALEKSALKVHSSPTISLLCQEALFTNRSKSP